MNIVNPAYNVIFKYMMNDSTLAKMLLSTIIGEKIVELDFKPRTLQCNGEDIHIDSLFYYVDFNAKIETKTSEIKTVIIDLYKDKYRVGIPKLKKQLRIIYPQLEKMYSQVIANGTQIYSIYFMDYKIGYNSALIKVLPMITELGTGKEVQSDDEFIRNFINHIEWIVKIPFLTGQRRTEAEEILNIFNQANVTNDNHILNIDEQQFSEKYCPIIRALQDACASKELIEQMQAEDLDTKTQKREKKG